MMTAEQLKASILQLAMQGKLVEQRPEEGTGEELFREIQAEKKKLIKEGKIKKQKTLSEIKEEEIPFDIPESWRWVKLGDVSSYAQPKEKVSPKDITPEMWSLDLEDIEKSTGKVLNRVLAKERKIQGDKVLFKKGNILYSKLRPYLLKILIADNDGITTPELVPFNVYGIKNSGFFLWYLRSPYVDNAVNSVSYGVKMPRVGTDTMVNLLVPLPPLAEQKRIVAKIEELMPFVEQYAAASTKLNTLNTTFPDMIKKSILQEAVQGKLVPQDPNDEPASVLLKKIAEEKKRLIKEGKIKKQKPLPEITEEEIPFDIPESWEWVRFSDIMNSISTGPFGSMLHKTDYENEGIPIVNPIHMQGGRIIPSDNSLISNKTAERLSSYKLQAGDIVLARRGDIGRSAVVHEAESGWICGTGSFFATPSRGINPDFISLMFTTPYVRQALLGESVGTTMNNLNQKILLSFLFPLPPEKEQERILSAFDRLNKVVTRLATIS